MIHPSYSELIKVVNQGAEDGYQQEGQTIDRWSRTQSGRYAWKETFVYCY